MPKPKQVYLVDASIYIFRAWFSFDTTLTTPAGEPVNAVYGYGHFLAQLLRQARPSHIAACFDESLASSFRNRIYPDYKANREPAPPELKHQFELCRRLTRAAGINVFSSKRYEADDLIATLAARARRKNMSSVVVSRDKDLLQVLQKGDRFWNFAENEEISHQQVRTAKGVRAEQIADFLALSGDAVDNIPGVAGIGPKTAIALLEKFKTIDDLYENLHRIPDMKLRGAARIRQQLEDNRAQLDVFRQLTLLKSDIPLKTEMRDLAWQGINSRASNRLFNELGFGNRLRSQFESL